MFTGIVGHLGRCEEKTEFGLKIRVDKGLIGKLHKGSSVAVNGVCFTVTKIIKATKLVFEVMPETWQKTMFDNLQTDDLVNLELPLKISDRLAGHIVAGHVDGVGTIKEIRKEGNSRVFKITIPRQLSKYIVEKGSIAVNGISLTVVEAKPRHFTVCVIPYTWKHTMLQQIQVGDLVNIEADILAKYVEKLLERRNHQ